MVTQNMTYPPSTYLIDLARLKEEEARKEREYSKYLSRSDDANDRQAEAMRFQMTVLRDIKEEIRRK